MRRPRHQARQGRDHPRHPERRRGGPQGPRRVGHRAHRRRGEAAATSWSARSRRRARPSSRPKRSCSARSSARRPATCATARCACRRACRASSSAPRSSRARAPRRTSAPRTSRTQEKEKLLSRPARRGEDHLASRYYAKMRKLLVGKITAARLVDDKGKVLVRQGRRRSTSATLDEIPPRYWAELQVEEARQDAGEAGAARRAPAGGRQRDRGALPREDLEAHQGRRAAAGRHQDGEGLRRHQAQAVGRRQDGRPPRQQGRRLAHPARGGHAVPRGRHAGRHRAEPARRAVAHERRPDPRDPPRLGRARTSASRSTR